MASEVLLVIDMVNDFVDEEGALYCGNTVRDILPRAAERIQVAREKGVPVIYIRDHHREEDAEFEVFEPHCLPGTPGAQIHRDLQPRAGEPVIDKRRYSAFYGTDLDLLLREMGVTHLNLVGVCTNICVMYTACAARMRNYAVTVFADSVTSFDPDAHRFALREMEETLGCEVVRGDE